jgi:hypothetical protein
MADVAETIEESGRRIGHHVWVEARLFEVVGRWSGTVDEPRARALFARQSRHHAWHVQLWHELLPGLPHVGPSQLVAPDGDRAALIADLEALDDADRTGPDASSPAGDRSRDDAAPAGDRLSADDPATAGATPAADASSPAGDRPEPDAGADPGEDAVARLTAVHRVAIPALVRAYEDHLERTTPVTDGPTQRVLRLVLADLAEDRAAGEALLDDLTAAG